tara:strand:+ start:27 stop:236 length:210 start_codon:yes stop_codon:yes gene_type:complete
MARIDKMKTLEGIKTIKLTQIEVDAIDSALRDYIFRNATKNEVQRGRVACTKSNAVLLSAFDKFKRKAS